MRTDYYENLNHLRKILGIDNETMKAFFRIKLQGGKCETLNPDQGKKVQSLFVRLEAMEKYSKRWWLSDDQNTIAYYQLREPIMLVKFNLFTTSLAALLGRTVYNFEPVVRHRSLVKEARRAFYGKRDSKRKRKDTLNNAFYDLCTYRSKMCDN